MKKIVAILMAMMLVISVTVVLAGAADNDTKTKEPVIIGFTSTPGHADKAMVRGHGGDIKYSYTLINAIAAKLPEPAIENIQKNPRVTYVEMDGEVHTLDDELNSSWGVKRIGAGTVHDSGNTGSGVKVAILDTGIDYRHSDLADNFGTLLGYDFVNTDEDPMDDNGHGTHCAGIVAAGDNEVGVVGVAPGADLYAVKVLDSGGSGWWSDVVAGIQWSVDNGTDVISMSLGSDFGSISLETACNNAYSSGVLLVAAAGNDGNPQGRGDNVDYPARYDSVIAVAATDSNDNRARWSSTGPAVELAAPGVSIYSTVPGGYDTKSGTSMACPHVAGTAALVIYSGITDNGDVRARLQGTADDLGDLEFDTKYGHGLVDADEAAPPTGNQPPVADAGADQTALVGETVSFDGSDSEDPDGTIMSYEWDFGDGTTTTGTDVTTTYPYSTAGIYTVTLTVTDDEDATGTDTASVNITAPNEPPVADANGPYTGIEGDEILFNGSGSYDPDGTIVTYAWDFGDGSTGTGVSPTYTYKANGTYTVALTVNDGKVDSAPSPTTATISDVDPVASFTSDSPKPEGEVMSFTDTSTSYDGILWSWDFGDEGTSNAQNPTREYAQNGTYTVTLTVTEADSDTSTETQSVTVTDKNPVAGFTYSPANPTVDETVSFADTSTSYDGITLWSWEFGDGVTNSVQNPTHAYESVGTYTVNLTVTEADGDVDTTTAQVKVTETPTNTMHVASIDMSTTKYKGRGWFTSATATVTIVDANSDPVNGAEVSGTWTGLTGDSDSGLTDSNGLVALGSDSVKNAHGTFTFTVDNVAKDGWTYDSSANEETSASTTV